ncbi:hypothetical protein [Streptomyces endophyticus]|uniref:Uncharacterized protein n=1 Tax=Streptomyces endophyticus TaxID=714166 RepID=A0ABU6FCM8_9ACTN|nr:hypothetical protein [Streptomyces endophyticus]MEB8341115.1 hypothetical protein [Streptomyces endophyticus]
MSTVHDDASTPGPRGPVADAAGLVLVEDRMFRLSDANSGPLRPAPTPTEDTPVTTGTGPDLALFLSATEDGEVAAVIELWQAPGPEPEGPWELQISYEIEVAGPELALVSGVSALGTDCVLPVPAGTYTLQARCRGRAAAREAFEAWLAAEDEGDTDPEPPAGLEHWHLRLHPRR